MANIKISELNALTEKADNDLLAIVDTSADETKKIQVSDLMDKNIELIAVTDTAPLECSIGDKYYNTTDKEIYTATVTNTWSDTGTTPISGILYIVYNDQASYSWDGTDLVSVGGGKEDIVIDDTEPTDPDVKLWIDTGEVSSSASEITNEYSTSTGIGYSANYVNSLQPKVLYENATGTDSEITLSDNYSNYSYIEVYYGWYADNTFPYGCMCTKVDLASTSKVLISYNLGGNNWYINLYECWSLNNDNKLTRVERFQHNQSGYSTNTQTNITKVIGYK